MDRPPKLGYYRDLLPTKIKKLYGSTYWANHSYSYEFEIPELLMLCKNREIIAERYNLIKKIDIPKKYIKDVIIYDFDTINKMKEKIDKLDKEDVLYKCNKAFCEEKLKRYMKDITADYGQILWNRDHTEYYKTKDKEIVSIFSMYEEDKYVLDCIEKSGYKIIEPIYEKNQKTFIKVIPTV
jgi:hypothetical protein